MTIKEDKKEIEESTEFKLLDVRFLEQPAFAVEQARTVTMNMAKISKDSLYQAIALLKNYDEQQAAVIYEMEHKVDRYEDELGSYLVKISGKNLSDQDSRLLSILLHSIGDFERISDHAINLVEASKEMNDKKIKFSDKAIKELDVYTQAIKDIIETAFTVFETEDIKLAGMVEPIEEVIDEIDAEMKKRHVKRLIANECTIELGFIFSDITSNYERIADHCSNLAVNMIQLKEDGFEPHEYLDRIKETDNSEFKKRYEQYKSIYQLP